MPCTVCSQTLGDLLRRTAARLPDKPAIRFGTAAWTCRDFGGISSVTARQHGHDAMIDAQAIKHVPEGRR